MPKELVTTESDKENESRWLKHRRMREGLFIAVLSLALFILLSLLSYSETDPNWFGKVSLKTSVSNSGGWVGAYLADILLFLLGVLAYALPFVMAYLAWIHYVSSQEAKEFVHPWIRLLGACLLILGASGAASFEFIGSFNLFPHTVGGIIGDIFSKMLDTAFNSTGTILLLVAMCFTGITLLTGLSWITTAEKVGFYTLLWIHQCSLFISFVLGEISGLFRKITDRIKQRNNVGGEVQPFQPKNTTGIVVTPRINKNSVDELSASIELPKVAVGNIPKKVTITEKKPTPVPKTSSITSYSLNKACPDSIPPMSLLEPAQKASGQGYTSVQLESMAREVEQRLLDFGIEVQVVAVHPGPVITRFELQLAPGIKVSRISGLAKDLARALSVISVRVVDVIPGKPVIGLELPNQYREMVRLSEVLLTDQFQQARSPISMALGVDIAGHPVVVDLAKMPHLLVAGTTGSGKSVGLNAMLLSILFKATPEEVRLILVDPKMLEFSIYDRIPHLLTPVVTDMKEAAGALRWCVAEMERRYRLMSALGIRNLAAYNLMIKEANSKGEPIKDPLWSASQDMQATAPFLDALPYIVVVIDELADMMMVVGKKVEQLIARIAQKARAAGIHLILATQRPSVDVLTGLIKSNIPTRIAFQVSSKIDSRTILDQQGADQLLGHGDMLYLTPGSGAPVRIHGAFVDDSEVHRVTDAWRERGDPEYVDVILRDGENAASSNGFDDTEGNTEDIDPLYDEAVRFVTETRKASISSVQRRLKVGYNRAARLIEEMERTGIVSAMESNGVRDVLAPPPVED